MAFLPTWLLSLGGGVLGLLVGSFVGAALLRLPQGRSVVLGRSTCDSCGRLLGPTELVPVLSFILARGKCRTCKAEIDRWQIAAEIAGAAIGALPWLFAHDGLIAAASLLMGWQLLLLALLDLRHLWLPTRLVVSLGVTGLLVVLGLGLFGEWQDRVLVALGGAVLGWGLLALVAYVYRRSRGREGMGRADPLLLGAIGLWLGPLGVVEVLLGASIAGIIAAAVLLAMKREVAGDTVLPLGTCLAAAAWPLFVLQGFG